MGKKILMACTTYWTSPFRVGSHQLARQFVQAGWDVAFLTDPISPLHIVYDLAHGISDDLRERIRIYRRGGQYDLDGRLWTYVPGSLLTPYDKPVLRSSFLHRQWHRLTSPDVVKRAEEHGFGDVDLLYFDSVNQYFWLNSISHKRSVYRVPDDISGFRGKYTSAMKELEHDLVRGVDVVAYAAENLKEYVERMDPRRTLYLPNGVDYDHFAKGPSSLPPEYGNIPRPIAVYVGAMDLWFDYELLNYAAGKLGSVSFVLIGPDRYARTRLRPAKNIHILGRRSYDLLPLYLHNSDIGIIPFDVEGNPALVKSVNPLKLYEYMASGLPVVATEWEALRRMNSPAVLCRSREEFVAGLEQELSAQRGKSLFQEFARRHDWRKKFELLEAEIIE